MSTTMEADPRAAVVALLDDLPADFGEMTPEHLKAVADAYGEIGRLLANGANQLEAHLAPIQARGWADDRSLGEFATHDELAVMSRILRRQEGLDKAAKMLTAWEAMAMAQFKERAR